MQLFFDPRSVALIGAPRQSGPGAYNNLEMMLRYGYRGDIYAVHPKVTEILGVKAYPRITDLPVVPDLAVISVGRDRVLPVFAECIEKGVKRVIVISQGFADADERGKELQDDLSRMAREHGVRVLGPNTMGVLNAFTGFSTAFVDIERDTSPPPLTLVAQSGVFQVGYESFTTRVGKAIDIGNGSDLDFVDALDYLENDPQTQIIVLHMEGMKRGREFLQAAGRVARQKPVIVLKTGRSVLGAKAALSHTGSLVGEDEIFDVAFEKAGLIRVRSMIELRAVSRSFLHFRSMAGPRLGVVTATGACGIMTADASEDFGLELAPFPEKIREGLEDPHIAWHRLHNPLDLWPLGMVSGSFLNVLDRAVRGLLEADEVDAVFGILPSLTSPMHNDLDLAAAVRGINRVNNGHKPIALWLYGGNQCRVEKDLENEPDVACFATIDEAVMGLAGVWKYEKFRRKQKSAERASTPAAPTASSAVPLPSGEPVVGDAAFELLDSYQIPIAPGKVVQDVESAVAAAARYGYPTVLKIVSPQWLHKSDRGGIRLHLASEAELRGAYAELWALFRDRTPEGRLDGILVQKEIQGTELLLGVKKDPQFGPILVAGMGGIYTEVLKDVARGLAPVTRTEAELMLRSLRIYPILEGARGQKGVRLSALVDAILSLSRLASDHPEISELDLNPVLASSEGCWCVDCRVVVE